MWVFSSCIRAEANAHTRTKSDSFVQSMGRNVDSVFLSELAGVQKLWRPGYYSNQTMGGLSFFCPLGEKARLSFIFDFGQA